MALPTITSNSPAAGSIAWTAFSIQYNGVSYSVAAGNTTNKYTWWQYNSGAPTLNGSNTLPDIGVDDLLLFLNKAGIGVLVPTLDVVDGNLIVAGSILAQAIGADQINGSHIVADAITSSEIAANAVTASEIMAGAVTTEKLSVGSVGNSLVLNGSFEEADATGLPLGWKVNSVTAGSIAVVTGVASSGTNAVQLSGTGTTSNLSLIQTPEKYIPVTATAGRKWYISMRAGAGTATTNGAYLRANWYDANKTYISYNDAVSNAALPTTWTVFEGQVTPPSTARYMGLVFYLASPNVATNMYVDEVVAREVIISAQIGDGAITSPKIIANAINATHIAAGTITADKILATDQTNYWENPTFEGDTVGGIPRGTTLTSTTNARVLGAGSNGSGKSMELNALSGSNNDVYGNSIFPVEPGDQYWVSFDYKFLNTAGTASAALGFRTYGPTQAAITWTSVASTGSARPTTWQYDDVPNQTFNAKTGVYTVPAGTFYLQPWVTFSNNAETTNRFHIDNIMIRRMNGGELIVDGSIIATKIATDAVTSTKILANSIIASKIAANAIQANHIAAGQIQTNHLVATAIDGMTITGASIVGGEVKTTPTANAIAARMGPTSVWDPFGNTSRPGIGFTVNGNTQDPAGMYSSTGTDLAIVQGGASQSGNQAYITLGSNNASMYAYQTANVTARSALNLSCQVGTANISGNQINLSHTNGLLVNGKDITQASVQSWSITSTGLPNQSLNRVSPLVADSPNTTDTTLATINLSNSIKITSTGVYDFTVGIALDAPSTGRSFVEFTFPNGGPHRAYFGPGEDTVNATATGVVLAANDIVYANIYQTTGGTRNYSGRFRITKVAAPVQLNSTNTQWQSGSVNLAGDLTVSGNATFTKFINQAHWTTQSGPSATFYEDLVPSGQLWGPGRPAPGSDSTDTGLISWPANDTIQFRDAGIYSLSAQVRFNSGVTQASGSQSFVSFEPTTNVAQNPAYAKGLMPYGDNQMSASVANVRMAAGQQIKLYTVQYSGATTGLWWRINVTRVG